MFAVESSIKRWGELYHLPKGRHVRTFVLVLFAEIAALTCVVGNFNPDPRHLTDFLQFYIAGKILDSNPPVRLYDLQLQSDFQHRADSRLSKEQMFIYAGPPLLAFALRPLSWLPYPLAFTVWVAASLALYLSALLLLRPGKLRLMGLLLALPLFAIFCMSTGQLSTIGVFGFAACIWAERQHKPFCSGLLLSICAYKPTLLIIAVPMLVIGRRYRTVLGVLSGVLMLATLSLACVGFAACRAYLETLLLYGRMVSGHARKQVLDMYVDLNSSLRMLSADRLWFFAPALVVFGSLALWYLGCAWARSRESSSTTNLLWAATIAFTLVFNVYVPIYDAILIVPAAFLFSVEMWGESASRSGQAASRAVKSSFVFIYLTAFVSRRLVSVIHFQVLTIALLIFGILALRQLRAENVALALECRMQGAAVDN